MTRSQLLKELCKAEKGKRQCLDAGQAREVWAKLRGIIGASTGVDIEDIIEDRGVSMVWADNTPNDYYQAFPLHFFKNGKPVKVWSDV